ncbi:hypothetical protein [Micromonospora sp. NPDC092111]
MRPTPPERDRWPLTGGGAADDVSPGDGAADVSPGDPDVARRHLPGHLT